MTATRWSRRDFLRATGWTAVGITAIGCGIKPVLPVTQPSAAEEILGWVQVRPDGRVLLHTPAQELGQAANAAFCQIVAEELGGRPDDIEVMLPRTDSGPPLRGTFGSRSIEYFAQPIAMAAAALRAILRLRAAAFAGVAPEALRDDGRGFRTAAGRRIELHELAGGRAVVVDPARAPSVTARSFAGGPDGWRWVGRSVPPRDHLEIVRGGPRFAADLRLPDLAHGRMITPPSPGARVAQVELGRARETPGFVADLVDREAGLVGIVARDPIALARAIEAVHVDWRALPAFEQADLDRILDVDSALARGHLQHTLVDEAPDRKSAWDVDVRVDIPFAAHAAIEPRAAVARWRAGAIDVWLGCQDAFLVRDTLARRVQLDPAQVTIHSLPMGGAFGGRAGLEAIDAALLARAARRPVLVQWTRPDEFQRSHHGPPCSHRVRARLGRDSRIDAWWHAFTSGHILFSSLVLPTWLQAGTSLLADEGVLRGAVPPYRLGRRRIEASEIRLPIPTGPWRGLGAAPNALAIELAVEELARRGRRHPIDLRLALLQQQPRLATCLRRADALAPWARRPREIGDGVGVAATAYHGVSMAAVIARAVRDGARARIVDVVCVQDCGRVINPDRVRAQIEGNLTWALGFTTLHALEVRAGRIAADYFTSYPLPTIADHPRMTIELGSAHAGAAPTGAGESAIPAAVPAMAIAAAAALDVPLTRLPVGRVDS